MGRKDKTTSEESKPFAVRLRQERQHQGISLTEMARRIGYSKEHLSRIETSVTAASEELINLYERELGLQILPEELPTKLKLELFWGRVKDVTGPQIDVDYALFVCHHDSLAPHKSFIQTPEDIVYWPTEHHVYPHESEKEGSAIIRSADGVEGGNVTGPDELGEIDFSKLPDDVDRIVVYIHIYQGSTRTMTINGVETQQLFKHADVCFIIKGDYDNQLAVINLGKLYPNNWGIVPCEFLKNSQNQWTLVMIMQPLDGDYIPACIQGYRLAAPGTIINLRYR